MIEIPLNVNSVHISLIQTGCWKLKFDSTYPVHLNGIIDQEEFHQSIDKINRSASSTKNFKMLTIAFALSMIISTTCFIVGGLLAAHVSTDVYVILFSIGTILCVFGSVSFSIGCCIVHAKRSKRIRQGIAEESMKYSSRSPIPCSWRLENTNNFITDYGNQYNNSFSCHLTIDIGRSTVPQVVRQSAPPPYSNQYIQVCSQCDAKQQDINAKFCSACGYSLLKY